MVTDKMWVRINVSLVFIAVLLVLSLFNVSFPTFGQAFSIFDGGSPACAVEWQGENTLWNDLDRCCLEVRKQLECKKEIKEVEGNKLNRVCSTGNGNVLKYRLNNQAFNYCKKQPIWS